MNAASKRANDPARVASNESITPRRLPKPVQIVTTKTTKESIVKTVPLENSAVISAVRIISDESGVALDELTDDTRFDDIGLDSLLGLMVNSRIRDELGLDMDSNVFLEVRTVGSFKTFLRGLIGGSEQVVTVMENIKEKVPPVVGIATLPIDDVGANSSTWTSVLAILAEESGIDINELTPDTNFSDIGVDSLLSLVVVSRMRDELDLDIPDQSLFMDCPTLESLNVRIVGVPPPSPPASVISESDASSYAPSIFTPVLVAETPLSADVEPFPTKVELPPVKPAWSIVLQGSPRNATQRLFLFPDGCGAATSYLQLPTISKTTAVIAFNSPFMKYVIQMSARLAKLT